MPTLIAVIAVVDEAVHVCAVLVAKKQWPPCANSTFAELQKAVVLAMP
jgi:hypothetical protein